MRPLSTPVVMTRKSPKEMIATGDQRMTYQWAKMCQLLEKLVGRGRVWMRLGSHRNEKRILVNNLKAYFERDFLNASDFYHAKCVDHISPIQYETEKSNFVSAWIANLMDNSPDPEQAAVIGAVEGNVQVVARAGSGKTATLVSRALFLQQHCKVAPDEMLLLAFNRKAAEEIRGRLASYLPGSIPHVMTFHALAYALIHPEAMVVGETDGQQSRERALQDEIDQYLRDSENYDEIRHLMMAHFRSDWGRIVSGGYNKPPDEMMRFRRSLPRETLDGKYVKSFGEKAIANFLFEHDIKYRYERNFWWDGVNHRPDFTIVTGENRGVVIEYFGLNGDPDYDAMSAAKRNYWREMPDWKMLEFFPHNLKNHGEEGFYALLQRQLEHCGISCTRLTEEELWYRIKDRAIDRFTRVVKRFIERSRKLSLTPEELSEMVINHECTSEAERQFLDVVQGFYASYLRRIKATGMQDFDGLLQEAAELVQNGRTVFRRKTGSGDLRKIRYVLIDEYQDFSELFHRLMEAIRKQNPQARFFCVGDDWQAINGFAGSDLRFFQDFTHDFPDSRKLHLTTNYRSGKSIVNVGNALMKGLGKPARAHKTTSGDVVVADLANFEPTLREEREHSGDHFTPAVLRLVNNALNSDQNVVLLARKNSLPWYVNYKNQSDSLTESGLDRFLAMVRAFLPEKHKEKVTTSTVHSYKGLQRDVVILLDAVLRSFPLLHSELIFTRIFGDNLEKVTAEERRLFYVALTRAVEDLFVITETGDVSPFLEDLEKNIRLSKLKWSDYPPLVGETKHYAIRVGNQYGRGFKPTMAIRDLLKAGGYGWDKESKTWYILRPAEGFSVKDFADQTCWSASAAGIEVRFYDDLDNEVAIYNVDHGKWQRISGDIP